jgi:WhiB family redox-sensing transcriptional regulator
MGTRYTPYDIPGELVDRLHAIGVNNIRNGACVGHSRLFFAPHAERPTNRVVRERKALALCAVCTVKAACEAWADRNRETEGIWAGKIRGRGGNTSDELKPRRQTKAQKSRSSCGTQRGAQLHRKEGTPMCAACETAWENMLAGKAASERRKRMQANAELARIREAS